MIPVLVLSPGTDQTPGLRFRSVSLIDNVLEEPVIMTLSKPLKCWAPSIFNLVIHEFSDDFTNAVLLNEWRAE